MSSPGPASTWTSQPSGTSGARLVRDRRRTRPGPWRRPARGGGAGELRERRTRPGSRGGRPTGARRRVRAGPGTSRRAACAPVAWRRGWRRTSAGSRNAAPPSRSTTGSPDASSFATESTGGVGDRGARRRRQGRGRLAALGPRHVGREDQRRDRARRRRGGGDRVGGVAADVGGALRERTQADTLPRHGVDVGRQRRVVLQVVGGVVADDVDDRRVRPGGRCAGWRARCRDRGRGAAAWRPACRPCGRSRRPRR